MASHLFRSGPAQVALTLALTWSASAAAAEWTSTAALPAGVYGTALSTDPSGQVLLAGMTIDAGNLLAPLSTHVFRLTDGGSSVEPLTGSLTTPTRDEPVAIESFGPRRFWIARGSSVLRTEDGGAEWESVETGATLRALHFHNAAEGVGVGDGGAVRTTKDGGVSWAPATSDAAVDLQGMFWANASDGWAWGFDEDLEGDAFEGEQTRAVGRAQLVRTTDGGETWRVVWADEGTRVGPVFFLPDGVNGWMATSIPATDADSRDGVAGLRATDDGGGEWRALDLPVEVGQVSAPFGGDEPIETTAIAAIHFDTPRIGRLVADAHLFDAQTSESGSGGGSSTADASGWRRVEYWTFDGGASWEVSDLGVIEIEFSFEGPQADNDGAVVAGHLDHSYAGVLLGEDGRVWQVDASCTTDVECDGPYLCTLGVCAPEVGGGVDPGGLDGDDDAGRRPPTSRGGAATGGGGGGCTVAARPAGGAWWLTVCIGLVAISQARRRRGRALRGALALAAAIGATAPSSPAGAQEATPAYLPLCDSVDVQARIYCVEQLEAAQAVPEAARPYLQRLATHEPDPLRSRAAALLGRLPAAAPSGPFIDISAPASGDTPGAVAVPPAPQAPAVDPRTGRAPPAPADGPLDPSTGRVSDAGDGPNRAEERDAERERRVGDGDPGRTTFFPTGWGLGQGRIRLRSPGLVSVDATYGLKDNLEIGVQTTVPSAFLFARIHARFGTEFSGGAVAMRVDVIPWGVVTSGGFAGVAFGGGPALSLGTRDRFLNLTVLTYGVVAGDGIGASGPLFLPAIGGSIRVADKLRISADLTIPLSSSFAETVPVVMPIIGFRILGQRIWGDIGTAYPIFDGVGEVYRYWPLGFPWAGIGTQW